MLNEGGIQPLFAVRNRLASSYTIVDESSSEGFGNLGSWGGYEPVCCVIFCSTCCKDSDSVWPISSGDASLRRKQGMVLFISCSMPLHKCLMSWLTIFLFCCWFCEVVLQFCGACEFHLLKSSRVCFNCLISLLEMAGLVIFSRSLLKLCTLSTCFIRVLHGRPPKF